MKTMLMLTSLMICFGAQANHELVSFTLESGKKVSTAEEVKQIFKGSNDRIDMIELKNGSIFYDTEIKNTTIRLQGNAYSLPVDQIRILNSNLGSINFNDARLRMATAGDGSGGG